MLLSDEKIVRSYHLQSSKLNVSLKFFVGKNFNVKWMFHFIDNFPKWLLWFAYNFLQTFRTHILF